ncbi:MAG: hypothetical protein JWO78_1670 [Micavibrio sp.]|nr:hypothetical protein [Micavibrio sp.]
MGMGTKVFKAGKSLWIKGIDLILPPRCVVSGEI